MCRKRQLMVNPVGIHASPTVDDRSRAPPLVSGSDTVERVLTTSCHPLSHASVACLQDLPRAIWHIDSEPPPHDGDLVLLANRTPGPQAPLCPPLYHPGTLS